MRNVYTYFVADPDAASAYFRCAADSEAEAAEQARQAGYLKLILYDVGAVADAMRSGPVRERVHANPFLGPRWVPLLDAIEVMTRGLGTGFWSIQVLPSSNDENATRPFVQASRNPTGSLQVEIGGRPLSDRSEDRRRAEFDFFGWHAPRPDEDMPLPWQRLSPHWSGRAIAERVLESLVVLYGVDESAQFVFGDAESAERVRQADLVDAIDDEVFRLPPLVESAPEFHEAGSVLEDEDEGEELERVLARSGDVRELPESLDEEVAELVVSFADRSRIGMPYIPVSMAPQAIELFDETFGSRTRPIHPDQLYFFDPLIATIYQGEWGPRVTFGLGGHGINSWALTYQLVLPGIAILWQVHAGLLAEAGQREERWRALTDRTRRLVHLFQRHRSAVLDDGLLLVVHSELRGHSAVKLVTWDDLPGFPVPEQDGYGARGVSLKSRASADAVFDQAEQWLRDHG